jgi:hypothetical protein
MAVTNRELRDYLVDQKDYLTDQFTALETWRRDISRDVKTLCVRVGRLEQWRDGHEGNCHSSIDKQMGKIEQDHETMRCRQETQGEKIARLAGEVAKWGLLIGIVLDILIRMWPSG